MYAKINPAMFNQNFYVNNSTPQNTPAATLSAPTANILEFSLEKEAGNKKASLGFRGLNLLRLGRKTAKDNSKQVSRDLEQVSRDLEQVIQTMLDPNAGITAQSDVMVIWSGIKRRLNETQFDKLSQAAADSTVNNSIRQSVRRFIRTNA